MKKEAYFDSMTHFDFKCLLPALLQVEDRMSMAHGLESRVPLLDIGACSTRLGRRTSRRKQHDGPASGRRRPRQRRRQRRLLIGG